MYKLAIIGSGPAGIRAAFESIKRGWKDVVIFEKDRFGGVCLNKGCIPTKFLVHFLSSVKSVNYAQELIKKEQIDFPALMQRRDAIVDGIRKATEDFLAAKGVTVVYGNARLHDEHTITVDKDSYTAEHILLAGGSLPRQFSFLPADKTYTPESFIQRVSSLPKRVLIVGGGAIGIEYACVLRQLGSTVTVVEKEPRVLPFIDKEVCSRLFSLMKREGITIKVSADVSVEDHAAYDCILVATGRIPPEKFIADDLIHFSEKGYVAVDDLYRTNRKNIYACGDCTGKDMYAYTAEYSAGRIVAHIAREPMDTERSLVYPQCIFSIPAVATIGLQEESIVEKDRYIVKKMFLMEQSPSHVLADKEGFVKIIIHKETQHIAGATILSKYAAELIHTIALAVHSKIPVSSLKNFIALHPTISESLFRIIE